MTQSWRWVRSPWAPKTAMRSTGPSIGAEPVGGEGAELDRFARFDDEVLFAEQQAHPSVEDVHPVVAVVDAQLAPRGWAAALGGDADLEGAQPAGRPVRERPHRQTVAGDRFATDPWVGRRRSTEKVVGADPKRGGEHGDVIEREASFAGLEPAEHRDVDVGSIADLLQGEALLVTELAKAPTDSIVDGLGFGALPAWQETVANPIADAVKVNAMNRHLHSRARRR